MSFLVCESCSAYLRRVDHNHWSELTEEEQQCILGNQARDRMEEALIQVIAPGLKERGFEGNLDGFRRRRADHVDLVTFQFPFFALPAPRPVEPSEQTDYAASLAEKLALAYRFRLELMQSLVPCGGRSVSPDQVRLWHLEHHKPGRAPLTSKWFTYEQATTDEDFRRVAESVLPLVDQAERIFADFEQVEKLEATGAGHGDIDLPDHSGSSGI